MHRESGFYWIKMYEHGKPVWVVAQFVKGETDCAWRIPGVCGNVKEVYVLEVDEKQVKKN